MTQQIFRRKETKYILTESQVEKLLWMVEPYLKQDKYFKGTNCSIYYDDDDWYLAINSREKPLYKEKIRVRSYGIPTLDDMVFVEIKKKYKGIGSKRRIPIRLRDFEKIMHEAADTGQGQTSRAVDTGQIQGQTSEPVEAGQEFTAHDQIIIAELKECLRRYHLKPRMFLAYDRTSYCDKDDPTFRITFDRNVRSRTSDLHLDHGDAGEKYFRHGEVVMEVKALDKYPLWFVRALSKLQIYPASFSKYGRAVERVLTTDG